MKAIRHSIIPYLVLAFIVAAPPLYGQKPLRYFRDLFDTVNEAGSQDINLDITSPIRQLDEAAPVSWVSTVWAGVPDQASDYHQQLIDAIATDGFLQLAGDSNLPTALVSPDFNFNYIDGVSGFVVGKKVSIIMDAGIIVTDPGDGKTYTTAAMTVCSDATLAQSNTAGSGFSMVFVEDVFTDPLNPNYFIQFFDGNTWLANVANPAGVGSAIVEFFIDDPADGHPYDGSGSTVVVVRISGTEVFRYEKTGGGYTNNYITLEGGMQTNGAQLATHVFNGLTVFEGPLTSTLLPLSTFDMWGIIKGLGVYPNYANDTDLDGMLDGEEFAIDGNPISGADDGKRKTEVIEDTLLDYLVITLPVREGAVFSGTPGLTADTEGITYFVGGSTDLSAFTTEVVERTPALDSGMPALSTGMLPAYDKNVPNPPRIGWTYKSFNTTQDLDTLGKVFLQTNVGPTAP